MRNVIVAGYQQVTTQMFILKTKGGMLKCIKGKKKFKKYLVV